ncbi:MAG: hypothetical protein ACJASV_001072, partial [Pseudorhodobacter sp.]
SETTGAAQGNAHFLDKILKLGFNPWEGV